MIRDVTKFDTSQIADIYNYYILNTVITFETEPLSENEIQKRINNITTNYPWIVYEDKNEILGYAYASQWNSRCAYKSTIETTIYLKNNLKGKGIGTTLYQELINRVKKMKIHAIIGGVALPNKASIALHEKLGYTKVAQFKEVGYKFNKWIDVGYWELINN